MTTNNEIKAMILWANHLSQIADNAGTPEMHWQAMDVNYEVALLAKAQGEMDLHEKYMEERYRHLSAAGILRTRPLESRNQADHLTPTDEFLAANGFTTGFWPPEISH
jgi:hypothetical protein